MLKVESIYFVLLSLVTALLSVYMPNWSLIIIGFFFVAKVLRYLTSENYIMSWLQKIITIASLFITLFYYNTLLGYEPAITFLTIMNWVKFYESKTIRDYQSLSFFLLLEMVGVTIYYQDIYSMVFIFVSLSLIFFIFFELSKGFNILNLKVKSYLKIVRTLIFFLPLVLVLFFVFPLLST